MKRKQYSFLDQRKTDFDQDYEEFCKQTSELHVTMLFTVLLLRFDIHAMKLSLTLFLSRTNWRHSWTIPLTKSQTLRGPSVCSTNLKGSLHLFMLETKLTCMKWSNKVVFFTLSRLGIPDLGISEKYQKILLNYGRDIEMVSRMYNKEKSDPPIGRDLPPIAGRIMWAQQLYRRIEEPMDLFKLQPGLLSIPEAKRIIRDYNRLAKVLLEFQVLCHQSWMSQVRNSKNYKFVFL